MTMFFILAALLVVLCLAWLLPGLFRDDQGSTDQEAVNISLARERRATLDRALADGFIDQSSYDYEREQLEYDLAADLKLTMNTVAPGRSGHVAAAVLVAVFVPVAAGALYLQLGNPQAITQVRDIPQTVARADNADSAAAQASAMVDLLPQLEARLASSPDDVNGWRLLGRSYLSVNDFAKAQNAFEKALALDENDVATLAQLAESIAMTRDGNLAGEPMAYLERSHAIDPSHEHTLWLLSIAQQQAGDHKAALAGFDQLTALAKDNPEALATIEQMRSRSLEAIAATGSAGAAAGAGAVVGESGNSDAHSTLAASTASIQVSVSLSDVARASVKDDDAVFIYARASSGPPMPLAVSRVTVRELPLTVSLDDSTAMIPNMTLSAFPSVSIGARVSASGNPLAQSGDWYAEQNDVLVGEVDKLSLTIDRQQP